MHKILVFIIRQKVYVMVYSLLGLLAIIVITSFIFQDTLIDENTISKWFNKKIKSININKYRNIFLEPNNQNFNKMITDSRNFFGGKNLSENGVRLFVWNKSSECYKKIGNSTPIAIKAKFKGLIKSKDIGNVYIVFSLPKTNNNYLAKIYAGNEIKSMQSYGEIASYYDKPLICNTNLSKDQVQAINRSYNIDNEYVNLDVIDALEKKLTRSSNFDIFFSLFDQEGNINIDVQGVPQINFIAILTTQN